MKRTWTCTKWILLTVLAPEFLIAESLADRKAVNSTFTALREQAAKGNMPRTRVHSLFANMGGFVIKVDDLRKQALFPGSVYLSYYHHVASNILALREAGLLEKLPLISEEELNDKSKSDNLIRAINIVQIA